MTDIFNIFPVQLFIKQLDADTTVKIQEEFQPILDTIEERRNESITEVTTDFQPHMPSWAIPPTLSANINDDIKRYGHAISSHFQEQVINYWAQTYSAGQSHGRHIHPNSVVSGAYYINAVNSVPIEFHNPNVAALYSGDTHETISVPTQSGLLVMFPSWLPHEVPTSTEDNGIRQMVSFNVV